MFYFNLFIFFILGICIGSFLNAVIYRFQQNLSVSKGRSFCPQCHHKLKALDLAPILSFLFLKGHCRYCKQKISWQYPLVELATGLIFVLIVLLIFFPNGILALPLIYAPFFTLPLFKIFLLGFLLIETSFLIVIFVYDLKTKLIPSRILYPAIIVALSFWLFAFVLKALGVIGISSFWTYFYSLVSIILATAIFYALFFFSNEKWMGGADFKLVFLLGLLLGWPALLIALLFAFWSGALIGLSLVFLKQKSLKSEIPFGPFLVAGCLIALTMGEWIVKWYLEGYL